MTYVDVYHTELLPVQQQHASAGSRLYLIENRLNSRKDFEYARQTLGGYRVNKSLTVGSVESVYCRRGVVDNFLIDTACGRYGTLNDNIIFDVDSLSLVERENLWPVNLLDVLLNWFLSHGQSDRGVMDYGPYDWVRAAVLERRILYLAGIFHAMDDVNQATTEGRDTTYVPHVDMMVENIVMTWSEGRQS